MRELLARLGRGWQGPSAEEALRSAIDAARSAWPGVDVPDAVFVAWLAERLGDDPAIEPALARVKVSDLYLACGCALGDERALAAFEGLLDEVDVAWARTRPPISVDEARQQLRTRLLVADDGTPRIALYRAEGDLRAWVRVAATRHLLNVATRARDLPAGDSGLRDVAAAIDDPELAYFKQRHGHELKRAFEHAVAALSPRERELLRDSVCERLTVDAIGEKLGVHRATAARWVAAAREALQSNVRRALHDALGASEAELESMLRVVGGEVDLSVSRILGPSKETG